MPHAHTSQMSFPKMRQSNVKPRVQTSSVSRRTMNSQFDDDKEKDKRCRQDIFFFFAEKPDKTQPLTHESVSRVEKAKRGENRGE